MRIALGVEYDGSQYFGWQRQSCVPSIQANLEQVLSKIANEDITVFCAGRTDAGVHATGQVIHFDTNSVRVISAWTLGVNANLPSNIAIKWAKEVSQEFHARFSAQARRYRYIIYNHPYRSAILNQGVSHYYHPLDAEKMHEAAQYLLGEHDFSAFRATQCQSKSPYRNIHHVNVIRKGNYVIVDIQANAFVYHMVRNIVGSLLEIGYGNQPEIWLNELLISKDRTIAAATAKPEGLYLVDVQYPDVFNLPKISLGPLFL